MAEALKVRGIRAGYGSITVLRDVDLTLATGEVHCLLGRNGAGKSTLLKCIMGLVRVTVGTIHLGAAEIHTLAPHRVPKAGIAYVPQGRRLFAELTVAENLEIGLMARGRGRDTLDKVFALFPLLEERRRQHAGTLSGGEQQMLAMARALCLEPDVLLLDEPTEGLMPSMVARIRDTIAELRRRGVTILLVEQRVDAVLPVADRVTFMEAGRIRETVDVAQLRADPELVRRYVGVT